MYLQEGEAGATHRAPTETNQRDGKRETIDETSSVTELRQTKGALSFIEPQAVGDHGNAAYGHGKRGDYGVKLS